MMLSIEVEGLTAALHQAFETWRIFGSPTSANQYYCLMIWLQSEEGLKKMYLMAMTPDEEMRYEMNWLLAVEFNPIQSRLCQN